MNQRLVISAPPRIQLSTIIFVRVGHLAFKPFSGILGGIEVDKHYSLTFDRGDLRLACRLVLSSSHSRLCVCPRAVLFLHRILADIGPCLWAWQSNLHRMILFLD
jgi:hypothetical protein